MICVVLDLDGVVYRGTDTVPGAEVALRWLADRHRVVFATNNSSRTPEQVADKIRSVTGFPADPGSVVTSALAAAHIAEPRPTLVVGGDGIRTALGARGIEVVGGPNAKQVVTGIDFGLTYDTLRVATTALSDGARWIATNTDATFPAGDGEWPGAGAIVAALAAGSGRSPEVAGKPHRPMIDLIGSLVEGCRVVVVGDRPETDLAMAKDAGWTAVLALSGVTRDPATVPAHFAPDAAVASLSELPTALERLGMA